MKKSRWKCYEDYLASEEWAKIRKMVLTRAHNRCQACNSPDNLHAHHRVYDSPWGEESTDDLICLCQSCHMLFHRNEKRIKKVAKLEKTISNLKKSAAKRTRKNRMEQDPSFAKTVHLSGPVRKFTPEEIASYNLQGDLDAPLKSPVTIK